MSNKDKILDLFYNKHLKQKEIANIVGTSTQYVSKVVRADKRNKEEKEHTSKGVEKIREKETEEESKDGREEIKSMSSRFIWRASHTFIYVKAFLAG